MAIKGQVDFSIKNKIHGWCKNEENSVSNKVNLFKNGKIIDSQFANIENPYFIENESPDAKENGFLFKIENILNKESETELKVFFQNENQNYFNNFKFFNSNIPKEKIFFLHIPKTAGSSLNEMLASNFKKKHVQFHIESDRANNYDNIDIQNLELISGHIRLFDLIRRFSLNNFLRITILRDPFHQLVSHINWVKYISRKPKSKFFKNHTEPIQEISLKLREINFDSTNSIEKFISDLTPFGHRLFNNTQTRLLLNEPAPEIITDIHSKKAIETLHYFDVIGTVEQLDIFMHKISTKMGWESNIKLIKANQLNNKYNLNKESVKLKEIFQSLIYADQITYNHVVNNS